MTSPRSRPGPPPQRPAHLEPTRAEGGSTAAGRLFAQSLQQSVARASLGVLSVSSLVGVWLATLLIWPAAGAWLGPLTYGRWMPVHMDLQLYGWCSLPAVGLLLSWLMPATRRAAEWARLALGGWVGALGAGTVSWLAGGAGGKLFLDWQGAAAWAFAAAQLLLWGVLAGGWVARARHALDGRRRRAVDLLLLVALAAVPPALLFAERPEVYPPVNPDSGGATGHSLLASTLGIVGLAIALPYLLGRAARRPVRSLAITLGAIYLANWAVWAVIRHGNVSHHDGEQVAALATLGVWPIYLAGWYRQFLWEPPHRRWLAALAFWAALLFLDGFGLFLPGVLEGTKFSNALVAHAHLAMAGLLTAVNMLMLISLAPGTPLARALGARGPWLAWNAACFVMVAVLTGLGWAEGRDPLLVPLGGTPVEAVYSIRLACGLAMLTATLPWLAAAAHPANLAPVATATARSDERSLYRHGS